MTLRTGKFALRIVATPAGRRVALSARRAYLDYVGAQLVCGDFYVLMATVAACGFSVAAVLKIIETERRQRPLGKFQRRFRVGVTDPALAKFLLRLMRVTAITLLMVWESRSDPVGELMANIAGGRHALAFHLLRIHVVSVRETFQPELCHLCRKTYPRPLRIDGAGVTDYAHLARGVCKIPPVALDAGPVAREYGRHGVVGALVAKAAILRLGLMFGPDMIKRRFALDDYGLFYIEDGRRGGRSRRRNFGRFVGRRLLTALAGVDHQHQRHNYAKRYRFYYVGSGFCHLAALCLGLPAISEFI